MSNDVDVVDVEIDNQDEFQREMVQQSLKRRELLGPDALEKLRARNANVGPINHGNFSPTQLRDAMEFATMMATADIAIPAHLRANPGACLAITMQAIAWQFEPFFVANKSYAVRQKKTGDTRIAYESQLLHAVIERRAPLERRLRAEWMGEGATRRCKVIGFVIGEKDPFEWITPEIGKIRTKNSPEWVNNPDKQLWYHGSRDWSRIWMPDVLGGAYTRDELMNVGYGTMARPEEEDNVVTRLITRKQVPGDGYDQDGIHRAMEEAKSKPQEGAGTIEPKTGKAPRKPRKGAEAPSEPQAEEPATSPIREPATAAEYTVWADRWIENLAKSNPDDAESRWDGERELRAQCRISVTERKRLEKLLKARCEEARKGTSDAEGDD